MTYQLIILILLTVGTYLISGTESTLGVIDNALAAGYRFFDTAHMYQNEKYLGNAFKQLLPKYKLTREDIFITTKFVPTVDYKTENDYLQLVQTSLKNLQTDYLDMMLLHWPGVHGASKKDVVKYRHDAWKGLSKFQKQGLIRSIGVSNFLILHLEELKKDCEVVPALNQVEWHPLCFDLELLNYCQKNGILLQAYSSLGTSSDRSLRDHKIVKKIAEKKGESTSRILLKWAISRKVAIIPKASSKLHLEENINLNFELSEEEMKTLDDLNSQERFDWDPNNVV